MSYAFLTANQATNVGYEMRRRYTGYIEFLGPQDARWANPSTEQIAEFVRTLIPQFDERFAALKDFFKSKTPDLNQVQDLQTFSADFFDCWTMGNHELVEYLGNSRVIAILEFLSLARGLTWPVDNYNHFMELADEFEIYRGGVSPVDELLLGYSWTLDGERAAAYSRRQPNGIVVKALLSKNDVLLLDAMEREIVPRPSAWRSFQLIPSRMKEE